MLRDIYNTLGLYNDLLNSQKASLFSCLSSLDPLTIPRKDAHGLTLPPVKIYFQRKAGWPLQATALQTVAGKLRTRLVLFWRGFFSEYWWDTALPSRNHNIHTAHLWDEVGCSCQHHNHADFFRCKERAPTARLIRPDKMLRSKAPMTEKAINPLGAETGGRSHYFTCYTWHQAVYSYLCLQRRSP